MTATQKLLPIRAELRRPVVDLAGARAIVDLPEDEIKDLIDTKRLPAWNIARVASDEPLTDEDDARPRRELRILAVACRNFAEDRNVEIDDDNIVRRLYGPARPFLKGTWFARSWNCDSGHVINLLKDKSIASVNGVAWSRGRNGTPCITWSSALAFLNSRRIK